MGADVRVMEVMEFKGTLSIRLCDPSYSLTVSLTQTDNIILTYF